MSFLFAFSMAEGGVERFEVQVDFSGESRELENYWRASGFTPGHQLYRKDMQMTLDYLAAVPNEGFQFLRPHWLLNLVEVEDPWGAHPHYDFEGLYGALDAMVKRGFKPVFEIMGFPKIVGEEVGRGTRRQGALRWVPDFEEEADYRRWYAFVQELLRGLEERYGREELETWFFESTNEPDGSDHFWDQGIPAFLNYWDATSEAIRTVSSAYQFGGPGNAHLLSDTFKALLEHAANGTNAITGERGAVLDFISVHHKALPGRMIQMERQSLRYVQENFPEFAERPFWNDEADPTWGWRDAMWWRPSTWYAAFLVRAVDAHNQLLFDRETVNYGYLINDNNFLGDWYQRSLLARWPNPEEPDQFWLVPKPVFYGMTLLSFFEGRRFTAQGVDPEQDDLSVLAVERPSGERVILVAHGPEFGDPRKQALKGEESAREQRQHHDAQEVEVELKLSGLNLKNPVFSHIRLDGQQGNAYAAWERRGRPEALDAALYGDLLAEAEPVLLERRRKTGDLRWELNFSGSGLSLLVVSEASGGAAKSSSDEVSVTAYRSFEGGRIDFVRWPQETPQMQVYHVLVSHDGGPYEAVTESPVLNLGFAYPWPDGVREVRYQVVSAPL
ncbi:MAG: GH39 family glycosyl hydrolase [Opitutales bacterium]